MVRLNMNIFNITSLVDLSLFKRGQRQVFKSNTLKKYDWMIQIIKLRIVSYILLRDQTNIDVTVKGLLNCLTTMTTLLTRVAIVKFRRVFCTFKYKYIWQPSRKRYNIKLFRLQGNYFVPLYHTHGTVYFWRYYLYCHTKLCISANGWI